MSKIEFNRPEDPDAMAAIHSALNLRREIETFRATWPDPVSAERPTPSFTWEALERQLADMAGTPAKKAMAGILVSATRKQAKFKPPELVLREILCLAWTLLDEDFQPGSSEGSEPMT